MSVPNLSNPSSLPTALLSDSSPRQDVFPSSIQRPRTPYPTAFASESPREGEAHLEPGNSRSQVVGAQPPGEGGLWSVRDKCRRGRESGAPPGTSLSLCQVSVSQGGPCPHPPRPPVSLPLLSHIRTPVIRFGAHPDNPG